MAPLFEQLGSELSFIRPLNMQCDWNAALHYCQTTLSSQDEGYEPTDNDYLLYELILKTLICGKRPFCSYFTEQFIVKHYGEDCCFSLKELPDADNPSIKYKYDPAIKEKYRSFTDIIEPWKGSIEDVAFDPDHPDNERKLFTQLIHFFGDKIAHCITPQAEISKILGPKASAAFMSQRADFLFSFPNGSMFIVEPGDHDESRQIALDKKRDVAFNDINIKTLRPKNSEIKDRALYEQIENLITNSGTEKFLDNPTHSRSTTDLASNYLFLLPSLITRVERLLLYFFLRQGLIHRTQLRIGIIERDLECAEISVCSFKDRYSRLCQLYGINVTYPEIQLFVQRNPLYRFGESKQLDILAQEVDSFEDISLDLLLDVSIKCNALTKPIVGGAPHIGSVRQTYIHNQPVRFSYLSKIRPIIFNDKTDHILNTFIRDLFRKYQLRPGQGPILHNVLSQKSTIGLLPTSAGKSLCYQLAALLTPGTTFVVDPIVALMNDQVQGLKEQYGIDRVFAWHASASVKDDEVAAVMAENAIVFLSPERLLRPNFRKAIRAINAADIFINYAVIDEAHCVSMWGHDFRPSYLTLERNFREYCTFQGRSPVIVALTGTASQLVLIDLKRELNIENLDAIIRPKTFNRPELRFSLVKCNSQEKKETLKQVMASIARRLNVQQLETDAHGIIFTYTPRDIWELCGLFVGDAKNYVRTALKEHNQHGLRYGMYSGSPPKQSGYNRQEWDSYKKKTLSSFKRGDIRMLFGNNSVSVGIDNERLNYIINYKMPQSLESYYQQCGRAGRSGQRSECYLIFSDDSPVLTQQWLNREIPNMPERWDDLGTVSHFHSNNFPGIAQDCQGANAVFKRLFNKPDQHGLVDIPAYENQQTTKEQAERIERYLSYWLILGVLADYEVTGMERNTVYHVRRHPVIEKFLCENDEQFLKSHLIDSLRQYLTRYRPSTKSEVEKKIEAQPDKTLSQRSISYLVSFIYNQIEYQRREAIRTMVSFCNQPDASPGRLRKIIQSYFDTSEKFSEGLSKISDSVPDFSVVAQILDRIDGFDDVEHLYWETRRLLDERFRADWAAANLFAVVFRDSNARSGYFVRMLDDIIDALANTHRMDDQTAFDFLAQFLSYLTKLDTMFDEPISAEIQAESAAHFYQTIGMESQQILNRMTIPETNRQFIQLKIVNLQLKEVLNARYSRIIG